MSVLIQIIGPKKKKHNFHLQNWRTPAANTCIDTPSRAAYTEFSIGSRGSGEGRVNRPRSRHCDRLEQPSARSPSLGAESRALREKGRGRKPRAPRGAFLIFAKISPQPWGAGWGKR